MSDLNRRSKSILQEINSYVPEKNKEELIESRAQHIISSAIYLLEMIDSQYSEEEADHLVRRLFSSIKGQDPKRFSRAIKRLQESKKHGK